MRGNRRRDRRDQCAFGANRVNFAPVASAPLPEDGATTVVEVRDARAELNGATIGFKRNGYGAKTGSVELANKQPLVDRVRTDLVFVLRERGYRAGTDDPTAELRCDAEILSFIVDAKRREADRHRPCVVRGIPALKMGHGPVRPAGVVLHGPRGGRRRSPRRSHAASRGVRSHRFRVPPS
jgi:hypothetical protein